MLSGWDIYWITRLDGLQSFILVITILGCVVGGILHTIFLVNNDEIKDDKILNKEASLLLLKYFIAFFIGLLIYFSIPSTKTMFAIKVLPKILIHALKFFMN